MDNKVLEKIRNAFLTAGYYKQSKLHKPAFITPKAADMLLSTKEACKLIAELKCGTASEYPLELIIEIGQEAGVVPEDLDSAKFEEFQKHGGAMETENKVSENLTRLVVMHLQDRLKEISSKHIGENEFLKLCKEILPEKLAHIPASSRPSPEILRLRMEENGWKIGANGGSVTKSAVRSPVAPSEPAANHDLDSQQKKGGTESPEPPQERGDNMKKANLDLRAEEILRDLFPFLTEGLGINSIKDAKAALKISDPTMYKYIGIARKAGIETRSGLASYLGIAANTSSGTPKKKRRPRRATAQKPVRRGKRAGKKTRRTQEPVSISQKLENLLEKAAELDAQEEVLQKELITVQEKKAAIQRLLESFEEDLSEVLG